MGLKPSTLLNIPNALKNRKYRLLFSNKHDRKSGPKGPSKELLDAIVDTKQRNPTGAARALLSKSLWLLTFPWIKMPSNAFWLTISNQTLIPPVHPG
jgi:hypothetical protein